MPRPPEGPKIRPNQKRSGTFYIYWTDESGRSREHSTGTREREEAHRIFADWLAERGPGVNWDGPRRAAQARIADVLDIYNREHVQEHVIAKATVGYSIDPLLDYWGEQTCDAVKPETCRAYVRKRQSGGVAASTAARELTVLRAALGYAHKNGKLIERPFVELPPRPPGRDRWLTRSEAAALLWESRKAGQGNHLPLFILLALTTGARPAALFELRWSQIDFDRDRIDFNQSGRRQTAKRRPVIPMPRRLRWFLLRAQQRAASSYVLSYRGKKLGSVKRAFRRACDGAGLGADVIPYTLRHTAGTWLAQAGVPLWQIGGWLGHAQERTTELYGHHSPDFMGEARKVMD